MPPVVRRLLPLAAAVFLLAVSTSGVSAATRAFPTQSLGDRGGDVRAIQGLLRHRGFPVAVDGIFGVTTREQVVAFQLTNGLPASGIVWPSVWAKLIVSLGPGSTGEAVKAVQRLLNEKRFAGIPVSGIVDAVTTRAIKTFQSHMAMTPHGLVGPTTWRYLIWHYDYPGFNGTTLCDYSDGYGKANWGTASGIGLLEAGAAGFGTSVRGGVAVGDVGLEHGGDIGGHQTHEVGLDVDVRPIRVNRNQCSFGTDWRTSSYDRAATRILVNAFMAAAAGHVKLIYFNDPVLIAEGLTTRYPNHDDHLHVRYCEVSHPLAAYRC
jgi:hypothetical protein